MPSCWSRGACSKGVESGAVTRCIAMEVDRGNSHFKHHKSRIEAKNRIVRLLDL
jgi:hypothetical protein